MLRLIGWAGVIFLAGACADSISLGGVVHRDVYVATDRHYYYVHHPDEGRMEKVSRKRTDAGAPELDNDAARRQALLDRYRETKTRNSAALVAEPAAEPAPLQPETFREIARRKDLALFEAQLADWRERPPEERARIEYGVVREAAEIRQGHAMAQGKLEEDIGALAGRRESHETHLARLQDEKAAALAKVTKNDYTGPFVEQYRETANGRQTPFSRRLAVVWREAARVESENAGARRAAVERQFAAGTASHAAAVSSIDSSMAEKARHVVAVQQKTLDSARRTGALQERMDALNSAVESGYRPQLQAVMVAQWDGGDSTRTGRFRIDAPFWRLNCTRRDAGQSGKFSITVFDAETEVPFTRISGVDALNMRVRVLDAPGTYFLEIDQDELGLPWHIEAVTFLP